VHDQSVPADTSCALINQYKVSKGTQSTGCGAYTGPNPHDLKCA
jgi:hypothetical protein